MLDPPLRAAIIANLITYIIFSNHSPPNPLFTAFPY